MSDLAHRLRHAIAALQAQGDALGADIVDMAVAPLRARLAQLGGDEGVQQLRQVSVLFTDVVGSTRLSQQLSPEDISAVMDGTLAGFSRIVAQQGGSVLQYAGDSLLAVFGTPLAHEDDALRAVRAGLAILDEGRRQGAQVLARFQHAGFGVRVGMATGSVLLGGGVDGDNSIRGITVNTAARMEQTAPPGSMRICGVSYRLLRGLVDAQPQPPLTVKGLAEPMQTWLVRGHADAGSAQAQRGVGGLATPMVGREAELALLQQAYLALCQAQSAPTHAPGASPALQVITLVADAGIGKSRLAGEFRAWTETPPHSARWISAHASEGGSGRPYGLLYQVFAAHAGLRNSDEGAVARARWLQALQPLLRSQGDAAVLGHLLGLDFSGHDEVRPLLAEGRHLRERGFFHASQALRRLATGAADSVQAAPLHLWLDDLHWADPGSLDFVDHLQKQAGDLPLLLLGTARPALLEQRPGWADASARHMISLQALAPEQAQTLVQALLARLVEVPNDLHQRITDGAEGNPYFMEELVNMLIDRGAIHVEDSGWTFHPDRLQQQDLPATLVGVLQARLDGLTPAQTSALQAAAVVGAVFWDDALAAIGLEGAPPLGELIQRQMIVERAHSSLEGRREFAFRHHLLHQVCYERVLQRVKVSAHARVARWLESLPGERVLDQMAEHFERGGEPASALEAWHNAANAARARYANTAALSHARRALLLVDARDAQRRYALSLLQVDILVLVRDAQPMQRELSTLHQLAEQLDDDAKRSEAAEQQARATFTTDALAALPFAQRALDYAPKLAPLRAALAGRMLVAVLHQLGRIDEARAHANAALILARRAGDRRTEGALLNAIGVMSDDQGDIAGAVPWYLLALACHREVGDRSYEAGVLSNLGYAELGFGRYGAARARFNEARELFARIGQGEKQGVVLINLALSALNAGQSQLALDEARQALPLLAAAASRWAEAAAWRVVGQAQLALGEAGQAVAMLEQSQARFAELGMHHLSLEAQSSLALALWAVPQAALALEHATTVAQALLRGDSLDGAEEPLKAFYSCWQVLDAARDERSLAVLAAAQQLLHVRARRIGDEQRRRDYLELVPHHRALAQAGASAGGAGAAA